MKIIYQTQFIEIGASAADALEDEMLITFKQGVPPDIAEYCFIHSHGDMAEDIQVGDTVVFDQQEYVVTAFGDVANQNLRELGHVTWRFDGADTVEFPGSIHVKGGNTPKGLAVNSKLVIKRS